MGRNLVPRANEDSSLGTSLKKWLKIWSKDLYLSGNITDGTNTTTLSAIVGVANKDRQKASSSSATTTTSLTYIDLPGMSLTTASGSTRTYNIFFYCDHDNTNADKVNSFALVIDGVTVTESHPQSNKAAVENNMSMCWQASIAPSKVVKIQFKTNANTVGVYDRVLMISGDAA